MNDDEARDRFRASTRAFLADLSNHAKRTQNEEGETVRIILDVPAEWLMLAEWEAERRHARARDRWEPTPFNYGKVIERPAKRIAKRALMTMLNDWFHDTLHHLHTGIHPLLHELSAEERADIERRKNPSEYDDGIPF